MTQAVAARSSYYWIPSLYALEGLFFAFVTSVSLILYQNFNFTNSRITFFTSLLTIPWMLKPVVAPIIGNLATKRTFILMMPWLIVIGIMLMVVCLFQENFFYSSILLFFMMGLVSSIFDMNVDGYYITQLPPHDQARFIGIRSTFYQIGRFTCQGVMVFIVSFLINSIGLKTSWQTVFTLLAAVILLFAIYHTKVLAKSESVIQDKMNDTAAVYSAVFHEFLKLPSLPMMIIFFIIYPIAENQLIKIVPLFLLDNVAHGGLGLNLADIAIIVGGVGLVSMLVGVILSGFVLARLSLVACLVPITVFFTLSDMGYILLSVVGAHHLIWVSLIVAVAQFGFGLSNGVYMLCLLRYFGQGPHSMSLYAIGTAFMGCSVVLGGAISGCIQSILGYENFFIWIALINIVITIFCFSIKKMKWLSNENITN